MPDDQLESVPNTSSFPRKWESRLSTSEIGKPGGRSITDVAASMGVSRPALSTMLNGYANLSADMDLRFERQFKISADTLMRMQTSYDLAQARLQLAS